MISLKLIKRLIVLCSLVITVKIYSTKNNPFYLFYEMNHATFIELDSGEPVSYTDIKNEGSRAYHSEYAYRPGALFGLLVPLENNDLLETAFWPNSHSYIFDSTAECETVYNNANITPDCYDTGKNLSVGLYTVFGYNFLFAENSGLFSGSLTDKYYLTTGLIVSYLSINKDSKAFFNITADSVFSTGFYAGVKFGIADKILHGDYPMLFLLGIEIRYLPIKYPGLDGLVQDWQISLPIRFALNPN